MDDLYRRKQHYAQNDGAITVAELRRQLADFDDDHVVIFSDTAAGNPMLFYRTKSRGPNLCQIELNELTDECFQAEVEPR